MPDKAKELNERLSDYLAAVNAQMPIANPNYDPNKPSETILKGPGKGRGQGKGKGKGQGKGRDRDRTNNP